MIKCDENHEKHLGILQYEIYGGHTLQFICTFLSLRKMNELLHGKSNKMTCAPNEDSDKPGYLLSLVRVITVRMTKPCPLSAQRRLWSDWMDAQADLSLRWAHRSFCVFCHASAQMVYETLWSGKYNFRLVLLYLIMLF